MNPAKVAILSGVEDAIQILPMIIENEDLVLIKGSRGLALNRLVETLTESEPEADSAARMRGGV